jgi:hypothetical protein
MLHECSCEINEYIVIRGQLRGHNDTPFGLAALRAHLVFFNNYSLVILFFNIVPLIMEFTLVAKLTHDKRK